MVGTMIDLHYCDNAGRWGLAASGPLDCHGNHCWPMLAAAVSTERAQGNCWHDQMVWAAFLRQVPCQFWA